MRIAGILRGFPGLGRVVSGVDIITHFQEQYEAEIRIFSYLQGEEYLINKGFEANFPVKNQDYSSIGIIPVGDFGEYIISEIGKFNPDIILIDGEPLMVQSIKLVFPKTKIVVLLNPFDVVNPYNQTSSSLFFNDLYSKADLAIVHGFWKLEEPNGYKNLHSINTIIRKEVQIISPGFLKNKICCVLGGGTANSRNEFQSNTISIANLCLELADYLSDFEFHIFCSDNYIYSEVSKKNGKINTTIHANIAQSELYFKDAKLIITRAGRNMISEVLFLGIPTIAIPSGCKFRSKEQKTNARIVEDLSEKRIINLEEDISINEFVSLCKKMIEKNDQKPVKWNPGNKQAIELILGLYNS